MVEEEGLYYASPNTNPKTKMYHVDLLKASPIRNPAGWVSRKVNSIYQTNASVPNVLIPRAGYLAKRKLFTKKTHRTQRYWVASSPVAMVDAMVDAMVGAMVDAVVEMPPATVRSVRSERYKLYRITTRIWDDTAMRGDRLDRGCLLYTSPSPRD